MDLNLPETPEANFEKSVNSSPTSPRNSPRHSPMDNSPNSSGFVSQSTPPAFPTSPFAAGGFPSLSRMPGLMNQGFPQLNLPRLPHMTNHNEKGTRE